jgi:predicted metal-dependent HD superfamily phosphohydrolase
MEQPLAGLHSDWQHLLVDELGADTWAVEAAFRDLVGRYAEAGRFYHNVEHLACVIRGLNEFRECARNFAALKLAGYFHDVIYDPRAPDNEERSAMHAEAVLTELRVAPATVAVVKELILKTKHHDADDSDIDGQILLDVDLAILAAPPAEYDRYARAIRQEYAWVRDDAYRKGRRAVLESFLQRPRIYRTSLYATRDLESRARDNLRREIATHADPNPAGPDRK